MLPSGSRIGVDPKLFIYQRYTPLQAQLELVGLKLVPITTNLIELIWPDRPPRPTNPVVPLALQYTGKTVKQKLTEVQQLIKEKNAKHLLVSTLDEIAWLLNLRGSDIEYNPVFFSYLLISENSYVLFVNQNHEEIRQHLNNESGNIAFEIKTYNEIDQHLTELSKSLDGYIWCSEQTNYALINSVPRKYMLVDTTPIALMKAIKNPVESEGMRNAHIKDAAALCCYFAWLENAILNGEKVTEISGAKQLEEFRKLQADFRGPSFDTISSVGPHGAIIHYSPDPSTDVPITADALYLCDSGGQYLDGTTDVTRTIHFGQPTDFEKECFTRVLKGQIKFARSIFPRKIKGNCLDSFAREYLWKVGLDYSHGTGHGIGSYLNVHEGPMEISWRTTRNDPGLEAGMFVSNEPGFYQDGQFGIRIEDIVQIVQANAPHNFNNRGFLTFDTITLVPKQTKLIVIDMLDDEEIKFLNDYHNQCRQIVGPLLDKQGQLDAKKWLWKETEPISR